MIRAILTISFVIISLSMNAQKDELISVGKKVIINSKILNENRSLRIYSPEMTTSSAGVSDLNKRYPVVYLLDGEVHFYSTVGIINYLSQSNGNSMLPEMIVVAIDNTNRSRDLVPSQDISKPNLFLEFLRKELIPYVDANYNTSPYKTLVGHSLGGLTVIDILTNSPSLFNAYIAIDPSMWYKNEYYLKNTIEKLGSHHVKDKRLFLGIANTLPEGVSISEVKKSTTDETQHIRSLLKLDNFLRNNKAGLLYKQKYYENENHNTSPLLSQYDGFRFIFDYFHLKTSEKEFNDSTDLIAIKIKEHYNTISEKLGYKNAAPEEFINYLAYDALNKKHYRKARALFELNIQWYPNNYNVFDSYADYFLTQKDTTMAIENYQKALKIKSNLATQKKLDGLTKKEFGNHNNIALEKYVGLYKLEKYNISIKLELQDSKLIAKVPGQNEDEFIFVSDNVFSVKGKQGYTITFEMDGNKPLSFTSVQPNGTFKAIFISN